MVEVSGRCVQLKHLPPDASEDIVHDCLQQGGYNGKYLDLHKHEEEQDDVRWLVLFKTSEDAQQCRVQGAWGADTTFGHIDVKPDYLSDCIIPHKWIDDTADDWVMMDKEPEEVSSHSPPISINRNRLDSINSEDLFSSGGKELENIENTPNWDNLIADNKVRSEQGRHEQFVGIGIIPMEGAISFEMFGSGSQNSSENLSIQSSQLFGDGEEHPVPYYQNIGKPKQGYDYPPYRKENERKEEQTVLEEDLTNKNKDETQSELAKSNASKMQTLGISGCQQAQETSRTLEKSEQEVEAKETEGKSEEMTVRNVEAAGNNSKTEWPTADPNRAPAQDPVIQQNDTMQHGLTNPNYGGINPFLFDHPQQHMAYPNDLQFAQRYSMYMQKMFADFKMHQQIQSAGAQPQPVFLAPMTFDTKGNMVPLMPMGNQQLLAHDYDYATAAPGQQSGKEGNKSATNDETYVYMSKHPHRDDLETSQTEKNDGYSKIGDVTSEKVVPPLPKRNYSRKSLKSKAGEKQVQNAENAPSDLEVPDLRRSRQELGDLSGTKKNRLKVCTDKGVGGDKEVWVRESTEVTDVECRFSSSKIKVTGFSRSISKETLELFFDNEKRSGGGEIQSMQVNEGKGEAIIEFTDREAVRRVLEKQEDRRFSLSNSTFLVSEYNPNIDRCKVFVSGLNALTTRQSLENYFEAKCGSPPTDVKYGDTPGTALVTFSTKQDIGTLRRACHRQPLETHILECSEVEVSRSVKVTGCRQNESKDGLLYYFENKRRSQGGDVEEVTYQERTGNYIVTFCNVEDAERVSQQEVHTLNQAEISVCMYYPELELDCSLVFTMPEPIELTDTNTYLQRFLTNNKKYHQSVDERIAECYGQVEWPKSPEQNIIIKCTVEENDIQGRDKVKDWTEKCMAEVKKICDNVKVEDSLQIAKEAWNLFKGQLGGIHTQEPDKMALFLQSDCNSIVIVGEEDAIKDVIFHVRNLITRLEQQLEAQQQTITKVQKVKRYQIILLLAVKFHESLRRSNVNVQMSHENAEVTFMGLKKEVDVAIDKMMDKIKSFKKRAIKGFRKESHNLLYKPQTRSYFKDQLSLKKVIGIWDINKAGELELYSQTESDLDKASDVLKKCIKEKTISVSSDSVSIIHSKEWDDCIGKLEAMHDGLFKVEAKEYEILIVGTDNVVDEIELEIQKLFDLHTLVTEFISVDPGKFRFIQRYKKQDLQNIQKQFARLKVDILTVDKRNKKGFQINGEKSGCDLTIRKMKMLLENVELYVHSMNQLHMNEFLKSKDGIEALKDIEDSTQCVVEISTADVSSKSSIAKPDVKARCHLGPCTIAVAENDMTCTEVDCIVVPTDSTLSYKIGLGAAVIKKGGIEIQTECDTHRTILGAPTPGKSFATRAGSLPCKILIHAVLPKVTERNLDESILRRVISSCLEVADKKKIKSIMFPLLGFGGQHQIPLQNSAKCLIETLSDQVKVAGKLRYLEEIYVCDMRPDIVRNLLTVMRSVMGSSVILTEADLPRKSTSIFEEMDDEDADDTVFDDDHDSMEGAVGGAVPSKPVIAIQVKTGDLDKMKVDVIVNSTNPQLNLSMGNVSRALLKGGGIELQTECKHRYPSGIQVGQLAVTTGGLLNCSYIFHGLLVAWDYGGGQTEKVLKNFVTMCLEEADKRRLTSMAFPALGTGILHYPLDFVAQLMFDTVNKYQASHPDTLIQYVYFVVWSGDTLAIQAFQTVEARENSWKIYASLPNKPTENTLAGNRLRTNNKFKRVYGCLTVEIDQGDITKEKSDVIVNSILRDLDLNTGQVSKAILQAAGHAIQTECRTQGNHDELIATGLVETSAGRLSYCKKIYHVESKTTETEWTKVVLKCLKRADSSGFSSISFPAMGTGGKSLSPESMSHAMFEAFQQFTQSSNYTHSLKQVRILIFQQEMMKKFIVGASGQRKSRLSMNILPGVKRKSKAADVVTIYIYGGSNSAVKMAEHKLDSLYTEETCIFSKRLIQKWQTQEKKIELQDICKSYLMDIKIDGSKRSFIIRGYNRYVQRLKKNLEKQDQEYAKEDLKQVKSTFGTSTEYMPSSWRTMSPQCRIDVVKLRSDDSEYSAVYRKFMTETSYAYSIIKIYRIQNKDLYRMYSHTKQTMKTVAVQNSKERQLWFPTSDTGVDYISKHGFDQNYRMDMGLGNGLNFDVEATHRLIGARCTQDKFGEYHMILANVFIGDFCLGQKGLYTGPIKISGNGTYDSVTDSTAYPCRFVVFRSSHCYPSYHIIFH